MKTFFLIAGETSGDLIGSDLIHAMRKKHPKTHFYGAGGPHMLAAGQIQSIDLTQHAVLGLWEVLRHYPKFKNFFQQLLKQCTELQPDALIVIDSPGFNLRFIKKIRSLLPKTKIFYYVSPQLWAWKAGRVKILERYADAVLCIFPFEPDWYQLHAPGLKTIWVGHPLLDRLFPLDPNRKKFEKTTIALLPGSRKREIQKHLPLLLEAAQILNVYKPNMAFLCLAPSLALANFERQFLENHFGLSLDIQVISHYTTTYLSRCHLALVTSGTATLECAYANTPMIVFYHVNPLTYQLGKLLVKVPYLAMVNLLVNKPVIPELVQSQATPNRLAHTAIEYLSSETRRKRQQEELTKAIELLGTPGASQRAANFIFNAL
ncbi:MAG: lipid-A-disaccharide synthase [Verrucomicrobiae bacterium]|nr:lipid-A-disaccharide synthase [Verrucomicrobiae bacterium]